MPEIRSYTVVETREVKVTANSAEDAARIAAAAFNNGQHRSDPGVLEGPAGVWGNTTSRVRTIGLDVKDVTYG